MTGDFDIKKEKQKIRRQILTLRNRMPSSQREEKSREILRTLTDTSVYQQADILLTYVEYQSEVMTTPLIQQALSEQKQVFAPKVVGEDMVFYRIDGMDSLTEGYKGIREPVSGEIFSYQKAESKGRTILMLMPGAVFDTARHRIGYGKGFYDRYLECLSKETMEIHTAALCFSCQMLEQIPYEEHDIRPEMVLTEKKRY